MNHTRRNCINYGVYYHRLYYCIVAIVLILLLGCVNQTQQSGNENTNENITNTITNMTTNITTNVSNISNSTLIGVNDSVTVCLNNYGMKKKSVIFIYADWCPHCAKMKPWVKQLEDEGYPIKWINSENASMINIVRECLSGIAQLRYIPEFVCPANKEDKIGEFQTIDEMRNFMMSCIG